IESPEEATLPSVLASLSRAVPKRRLVLTVVYHPDSSLIGARSLLPVADERVQLGRHHPLFASHDYETQAIGRALNDPHVSRVALTIRVMGGGVTLSRNNGSCRCRVNGSELASPRTFSAADVGDGIRIFLAHGVVLLLRHTLVPSAGVKAVPRETVASEMVGESYYMEALRAQILRAAGADDDVLILGETGTGKELVAQAIHAASPRARAALVAVNMAAIPAGLAPTLLFGNAKGAYTGALGAARGYFEQAEGGTLFLDEVGDTPAEIQAQLLRALQQREIQPVGGPVKKVNVRIVSATDADIDSDSCGFKGALRHRLGVCEIRLKPLRDHREDIGELAWAFLSEVCVRQGKQALLPQPDSPTTETALWAELFHLLLAYHWPGNIRELANRLRQLVYACDTTLTVPAEFLAVLTAASPEAEHAYVDAKPVVEVSEAELDAALVAADYQVAEVARTLQVSRQSVYRHIERSKDLRLAADIPMAELLETMKQCAGDLAATAQQLKVSPKALRGRLREPVNPPLDAASHTVLVADRAAQQLSEDNPTESRITD
ncbi:MAG: sigma 54-interacting transcriptional regulator, partial [Halieaceae bacterium]